MPTSKPPTAQTAALTLPCVALYARVSTDDQADRGTVEAQLTFIRSFAELFGLAIVEEYVDDGISGTVALAERPAGRRLLDDARAHRFSTVVVYRLDRLGRSLKSLLDAHAELEAAGIDIRSASEPFDTSTPIGRFVFQLLGSMAELEKSTIGERMSLGRDRVAQAGKWTGGHVPYGFEIDADGYCIPSDRMVPVVEMTEADLVRDIFGRIAAGSGVVAEARRLADLGVPARSHYGKGVANLRSTWTPTRISRMVANPVYYGTMLLRSRHGTIERSVPALVGPELAERARAQIERNKLVKTRPPGDRRYLLRGLVWCENCGHRFGGFPMHGRKNGSSHIAHYYRCGRMGSGFVPADGSACDAKYIGADWLEAEVWADCRTFARSPGKALDDARARLAELATRASTAASSVEPMARRLREKERERERIMTLYRRGSITLDDVERQLDEAARETDRLSAMIAAATAEQELVRASREHVIAATTMLELLGEQIEEIERTDDRARMQQVVEQLVRRVEVRTEGKGREKAAWISVTYVFGKPTDPGQWLRSRTGTRSAARLLPAPSVELAVERALRVPAHSGPHRRDARGRWCAAPAPAVGNGGLGGVPDDDPRRR